MAASNKQTIENIITAYHRNTSTEFEIRFQNVNRDNFTAVFNKLCAVSKGELTQVISTLTDYIPSSVNQHNEK